MDKSSYLIEINDFLKEYASEQPAIITKKAPENIISLIDKLASRLKTLSNADKNDKATIGKLRYLMSIISDITGTPLVAEVQKDNTILPPAAIVSENGGLSQAPPSLPSTAKPKKINFITKNNASGKKQEEVVIEADDTLKKMLEQIDTVKENIVILSNKFILSETTKLIIEKVQRSLETKIRFSKLDLCGSCKYKIWVPSSSIDVSIIFDLPDLKNKTFLENADFINVLMKTIQEQLTDPTFANIELIKSASWIGLKFTDTELNEKVSLSIYRPDEKENAIFTMAAIIPRAREFLLLLKLWMRKSELFSGYITMWLGLFFLSSGPKRLLPYFKNGQIIGGKAEAENKDTSIQLLQNFFIFYQALDFEKVRIELGETEIYVRKKDDPFAGDNVVITSLNKDINIASGVPKETATKFTSLCKVSNSLLGSRN